MLTFTQKITIACSAMLAFVSFNSTSAERELRSPPRKLTTQQAKVAAANYQKYCALATVKTAKVIKTITHRHFAVKA